MSFEPLSTAARQAAVAAHAGHRAWPMPESPWMFAMTWLDLAFLHWRVDGAALRKLVPPSVELETFDGAAWVGIVPFVMTSTRLRGVPPLPPFSRFPELNVRTYVTRDGRPGIWFFSLDAASRLFVEGAKWRYKLPYHHAQMSCRRIDEQVHYESARPGGTFSGNYRGSGDLFQAEPGTLEHFLTERYCLYTENGGRVYRADIHHPPWDLQQAEAAVDLNTMAPLPLPDEQPHALFSPRQDVVVWPLEEISRPVSPQRRSALVSVGAAAALVVLKLSVGLATHSLGLVSEAAHSGTDLVAALLTFFAIRVAARPADVTHQFGHGKAEHLSALAEAGFLVLVSLFISLRAIERLAGFTSGHVQVRWYSLAVIGVVLVIDASRTLVSWRTARQVESAALASNALHFASDLLGSLAVLIGFLFAEHGHANGDPIAALFVGALVLLGASRLIKVNVDVLMDRAPADAEAAARAAIDALEPAVDLRRLRMRAAGGRQFADVVIGVSATAGVGQGHAAADAIEEAVGRVLPNADVVVHVEPLVDAGLRERAHAAALAVPRVREVHNIQLVDVGGKTELSLHVKLPGELSLDEAHDIAEQLESVIRTAIPEIHGVQTHLEPLAETTAAREVRADGEAVVRRIVLQLTGSEPRELRFLRSGGGLVAFLTLGLDGTSRLADAHARASEIEEAIRRERPDIADVIVHTEP